MAGGEERKGPDGQAMVELLLVLPVLGLLVLGAVQFALTFHAKITLNYAAWEAARAGSLDHADLTAVRSGLVRGLTPLFSYSKDSSSSSQVEGFSAARQKVEGMVDSSLVRIERLSPTREDFTRFGVRTSSVKKEIPNDHLRYRPSGTKDGHVESRAGSIQDANLLHLRVTYWYPLYVPVVNQLTFAVVCCKPPWDKSGSSCRWKDDEVCQGETPRIPLTAVAAIRMQSTAQSDSGYNCSQLRSVTDDSGELESGCVH